MRCWKKDLPYDKTLYEAMKVVGETLNADRCFIYVRQPDQERGRIAFCWRKDGSIPDVVQPDWQPDTTDLPQEDPLFRSALDSTKVIYVDDVKTAGPGVLNEAFENKTFGHRALIHAPIHGTESCGEFYNPAFLDSRASGPTKKKRRLKPSCPSYSQSLQISWRSNRPDVGILICLPESI